MDGLPFAASCAGGARLLCSPDDCRSLVLRMRLLELANAGAGLTLNEVELAGILIPVCECQQSEDDNVRAKASLLSMMFVLNAGSKSAGPEAPRASNAAAGANQISLSSGSAGLWPSQVLWSLAAFVLECQRCGQLVKRVCVCVIAAGPILRTNICMYDGQKFVCLVKQFECTCICLNVHTYTYICLTVHVYV